MEPLNDRSYCVKKGNYRSFGCKMDFLSKTSIIILEKKAKNYLLFFLAYLPFWSCFLFLISAQNPLKPNFYIVKLGFTGVYINFLISAQKHRLWVLVRTALQRWSEEYSQSMFWAEIWKILEFFYLKIFSFWRWNFQYIWIGMFS